MLLFIIAAVIAIPRISQATDLIASITPDGIVVSLLFAAVALFASDRLQMPMHRTLKPQGSRPDEALAALLRRYVPDVVARHVNSGRELTSCEREISVLFADIRGFTSFCEQHTPAEIFHVVNRFTGKICQTIRLHGGHVVEFSGDGVMAVFGAPNAIVRKERAAVQAGCAILEAMKALTTDSSNPSLRLSVGVGIATGKDFVGNIQADRTIWTALGNTTNLASRLQNLTRELHVAMAIDAPTRVALEPCTMTFEHRRVVIRGRRDAQDVHVLRQPRSRSQKRAGLSPNHFCWTHVHPSLAAIGFRHEAFAWRWSAALKSGVVALGHQRHLAQRRSNTFGPSISTSRQMSARHHRQLVGIRRDLRDQRIDARQQSRRDPHRKHRAKDRVAFLFPFPSCRRLPRAIRCPAPRRPAIPHQLSRVGSAIRPRNKIAPLFQWRMANRNGWSARKMGIGGGLEGTDPMRIRPTIVAEAAWVPSSCTSTKALWKTPERNSESSCGGS